MSNQKIVFEGLAFFAKVKTPNELAQAYTLDVVVTDPKFQTLLANQGVTPAKKADGSMKTHTSDGAPVFIAKRKVQTRSGVSLGVPLVLDSNGNKTEETIGNGSKVKVTAAVYTTTFAGKTFQKLGLDTVQVLELVPYVPTTPIEGII